MKVLKFRYYMDIRFDAPVKDHHFTLKCLPRNGQGQLVESMTYEVFPNHYVATATDSFSNRYIYGFSPAEHDHFTVDVEGVVRTGMGATTLDLVDPPKSIFKYQTKHTAPTAAIKEYHASIRGEYANSVQEAHGVPTPSAPNGGGSQESEAPRNSGQDDTPDVEQRATFYMHCLHRDFVYESGATNIATTAGDAFDLGKGVCQDYTHVLLSLLRLESIPCRYVTGMIEGEGLSHAWVEFHNGQQWVGLDPTNDIKVTDGHISISRGRDYKDCMVNKGLFVGTTGNALQHQTISVEVETIG